MKRKRQSRRIFWSNDCDDCWRKTVVELLDEKTHVREKIRFVVRGDPKALQRPRLNRRVVYDPSGPEKKLFKNEIVAQWGRICEGAGADMQMPLFKRDQPVAVNMTFRMRRPNSDFVGGKRGMGRLKEAAVGKRWSLVHKDADNMEKFVLDCLCGVLYADDCQVVDSHKWKVKDSEGDCNGAVEIEAQNVFDGDLI